MARQPNAIQAPLRPKMDDTELERLLHPRCFYGRPDDVLADPALTRSERRAILSSWASDACAVESSPGSREPPLAERPVTFDEIMDALVRLNTAGADAPRGERARRRRPAQHRRLSIEGRGCGRQWYGPPARSGEDHAQG